MSPLLPRFARYRLLCALAAGVLALDQATKLAIDAALPFNTFDAPGHIEVIPGFLNLAHVGNTGAAWSILSGRSPLLAMLALVALVAIFLFRRHIGLEQHGVQIAFGLLCGGIVGNLIDRVAYGHVIDFLDFRFGDYIYPTFNVADCGIVCGVALYIVISLFFAPPDRAEKSAG